MFKPYRNENKFKMLYGGWLTKTSKQKRKGLKAKFLSEFQYCFIVEFVGSVVTKSHRISIRIPFTVPRVPSVLLFTYLEASRAGLQGQQFIQKTKNFTDSR